MVLSSVISGPFLLAGGLGEDAFVTAMAFVLAGCSLGIVGLIASFYRNYRGVSIGFSVAAIGVWLCDVLVSFEMGEWVFQKYIVKMTRWSTILLMHPPLLLGLAALIIQQFRSRSPRN